MLEKAVSPIARADAYKDYFKGFELSDVASKLQRILKGNNS